MKKSMNLWDLSHLSERVTVMDVYNAVMKRAKKMREESEELKKNTYNVDSKALAAVADELYIVASALENTEEVNPTK